jgi:hypothetical protein
LWGALLRRSFGARRVPQAVRTKLNVILVENIAFSLDLYGLSLMKNIALIGKHHPAKYCRDYGEPNERRRCCGCR